MAGGTFEKAEEEGRGRGRVDACDPFARLPGTVRLCTVHHHHYYYFQGFGRPKCRFWGFGGMVLLVLNL